MKATAQERRAQRFREFRAQRERERQQRRDQVIAEFGGDVQLMADAVLEYRRALSQLGDALSWAQQGALFCTMGPGPFWKEKHHAVRD